MQPLLPKLKSSLDSAGIKRLAEIAKPGIWEIGTSGDLNDLAGSLEIGKIDPNYLEVDSIPDMWARPLLFEMAFFDKNHLLHDRIIAEWRGLLAMLALKEIRNLPLDASEVKIPKREKRVYQSDEEKKTEVAAPDFLQALGDLVPEVYIAKDTDWHRVFVILFKGRPIGMTSPTTLVCTAVSCFNRIHDVPWFNGRLLENPVSFLNDYEKRSLVSWLDYVRANLAEVDIQPDSSDLRNELSQQMAEFQKELGKKEGQGVEPVPLSQAGMHLEHGIYQYIDKPVKRREYDPDTSHVKLMPSRKEPTPSPTLLVVDKQIARQWNTVEQDVVVIGSTTLSSFPFAGLGKDRKSFGSTFLEGAEWIKPEMFFTSKLFYVDQRNAFPGCIEIEGMKDINLQNRPITPIIPLQPWVLKYFTLDDLKKRIAFEKTNDGVLLRFTLPLQGHDQSQKPTGKVKEFVIKKEYRNADNDLFLLEGPKLPVVEIWPKFIADRWEAYYTYYSRQKPARTFYAEPITPGVELERQSEELNPCSTPTAGECFEQIVKLNRFPEAMACYFDVPVTSVDEFETIPAGVLLLKLPQKVEPQSDWKIGIDFGTTGTNVFYQIDEAAAKDEPDLLKFQDHFIRVTAASEVNYADSIFYRFVAGENANAPFLTLYHNLRSSITRRGVIRPLLDGHIFFKDRRTEFYAGDESFQTNLKWGKTEEDRQRAEAFLTQLCLQCAAEAVSQKARQISWRYSFPTAFSPFQRDSYARAWNNAVEWCYDHTGIGMVSTGLEDTKDEVRRERLKPIRKTESVASGQFFADKPDIKKAGAPFGSEAACIDIGGGTTDISIWKASRPIWQASLRFAGRDMFLSLLYQKPGFLSIFESDISKLLTLAAQGHVVRFYTQLDVLLKENWADWRRILHQKTGTPAFEGFIQLIALSLSGIMFYAGEVLGALSQDVGIGFPSQIPNVFVGGNGARMFDWLTGGESYTVDSEISELFKTMVIAGSGFNPRNQNFKICISPSPKHEVAYGLVSDVTNLAGVEKQESLGVIAGEAFIEQRARKEWHESISANRLHTGLEKTGNLLQFTKFLETFNGYAKSQSGGRVKAIKDYASPMEAAGKALSGDLSAYKYTDEDNIEVQPLFIMLVKHFVDIKVGQWVKTQQSG